MYLCTSSFLRFLPSFILSCLPSLLGHLGFSLRYIQGQKGTKTISMPVKLGVIIQVKLLLQSHGRGFPRYKVLVALICLSSHIIDVSPLLFPLQLEMRYQINQPLVNTIFHKALTCSTFFTCLVGGLLKSGKIL